MYLYVPTSKKYNYPQAEGLLVNTKEKRFSFMLELDANGKAIGDTSGKVINGFQRMNPGVKIVKVETKRLTAPTVTTSTPIKPPTPIKPSTPIKNQVKPVKQEMDSNEASGIVIVGAAILAWFLFH